MRLEKHLESLREVIDEIKVALEEPAGLTRHQRRLALMLPLGVCELVEIYFHKLGIMKDGGRIKHGIFRKKDVEELLSHQIMSDLNGVKHVRRLIEIASDIEKTRDDLAYGAPLSEESPLNEKIESFLELKRLVETEVGGLG